MGIWNAMSRSRMTLDHPGAPALEEAASLFLLTTFLAYVSPTYYLTCFLGLEGW